jgi:hypothetical protein
VATTTIASGPSWPSSSGYGSSTPTASRRLAVQIHADPERDLKRAVALYRKVEMSGICDPGRNQLGVATLQYAHGPFLAHIGIARRQPPA